MQTFRFNDGWLINVRVKRSEEMLIITEQLLKHRNANERFKSRYLDERLIKLEGLYSLHLNGL